MKAKTLGVYSATGSLIIGFAAYRFYQSGKPTIALIWGTLAVIWVVLSIINFGTARRQSGGH